MPKIISVGGGKGGIGKSFFSSNLGGLLGMVGKKTLVIDLDTGGPNIHSFYGITNPKICIQEYFDQKKKLDECCIETQIPRLSIISSKNCSQDIGNLPYSSRLLLLNNLKLLNFDFIILDLGSGINKALIDFFLMADYPFVLFSPDPLSLENAFRFVHKSFIQKMLETIPSKKLNSQCRDMLEKKSTARPLDILNRLKEIDSPYYSKTKDVLDNFSIYLVANKLGKNISTGKNVEMFYKKFFGDNIKYISGLPLNSNVEKSVYQRKLFVAEYKQDKLVKNMMKIIHFLL